MREQGDSEIATANGPGIGTQDNKETNSRVQRQNAIIKGGKANMAGYQDQNTYGTKTIKNQKSIIANNIKREAFIGPKTYNNVLKTQQKSGVQGKKK